MDGCGQIHWRLGNETASNRAHNFYKAQPIHSRKKHRPWYQQVVVAATPATPHKFRRIKAVVYLFTRMYNNSRQQHHQWNYIHRHILRIHTYARRACE